MKKNRLLSILSLLLSLSLGLGIVTPSNPELAAVQSTIVYADEETSDVLPFKGEKQIQLQDWDALGRAQAAHIQLKEGDQPTKKRTGKITFDPVGWHNYKFYFGDGSQQAWLMNRGHLIGYQFSGLNDEGRNLVPMTTWLNTGNYKGTDESNPDSMLYYENRLDSWLATHPNYWLDYKVTPIYTGDELIPRQIELQYVGLDDKGQKLDITLGGKETKDASGITRVVLDNLSPNADIDYTSGTAINTVASASQQAAEKQRASEEAARAQAEAEASAQAQAQAEEQARLQAEAQAQAQAAAQAQAEAAAQTAPEVTAGGGYTRDARGRWHRPNGQYASKAEIAAAGLPW
ncbi:DNA/RNA non-specific endonuclease [Streptococcus sp. NLN76]|uniref:DNA/RNA non-specific endonuclease n=1 Tax=Streptococcus sp. NLN76 TaxID=2822800 RepID=UPI0018AC3047|nr:DNA/RNA non-specific endonuclease [Streptococcus sp. NLN76]MBF8970586.1 DNA/RNA non-specific endonuclease [Streptococcus sp. NLN76]